MAEPDYHLQLRSDRVALSGSMRLLTLTEYRQILEPLYQILDDQDSVVLDIHALQDLNSTGITALAQFILVAKTKQIPVTVILGANIPWQVNTIPSLAKLYDGLSQQILGS
tara:strand:- start:313 stop:645 length:333 start_codon:yes stop_codon:yes gene_type:complete